MPLINHQTTIINDTPQFTDIKLLFKPSNMKNNHEKCLGITFTLDLILTHLYDSVMKTGGLYYCIIQRNEGNISLEWILGLYEQETDINWLDKGDNSILISLIYSPFNNVGVNPNMVQILTGIKRETTLYQFLWHTLHLMLVLIQTWYRWYGPTLKGRQLYINFYDIPSI